MTCASATLFPELFDAAPIPGLSSRDALLSAADEQALIAEIACVDLSPFRFQGWEGKRRTASFGWRYDFDTARFAPAEPIPDWLLPLRAQAAALAGLAPADLVQVLLTRYDPGAGIGWHRDRPVFDRVVGISLGAAATMRFRRRRPGGFDRASLPLTPRSAYHLGGEARRDWEHSIAPGNEGRWSITFRSLASR